MFRTLGMGEKLVLPLLASILILGSLGLTQQVFATTVFSTDFNAGAPSEFSGITTTESVQNFVTIPGTFTGDFLRNTSGDGLSPAVPGNPVPVQSTILTLTDLSSHDSIDVNFLLAIIDTWDGTATGCGAENGPDVFNVKVDGALIFSHTFDNTGCGAQTYSPPAGVELARKINLGFASGTGCCGPDSAYDMGADSTFDSIPHTSSTLTIEWFTNSAFSGNGDESWAIDNVEVILNGVISEPPLTDADGDGFFAEVDDCDDGNAAINPGATEVFNGLDDNCVGGVDEGITSEEAADTITDDIQDLIDDGTLNKGQGNSLTSKLENIINKFEDGKNKPACNQLNAFTQQVDSLVDDGVLTSAEGQPLIDQANLVKVAFC